MALSFIAIMAAMDTAISLAPTAAPPPAPVVRLPGDLAIWFFIMAELLVFGVLFAAYGVTRAKHLEMFNLYQQTLNRDIGAINTLLLISGSGCVAIAVHRVRAGLVAAGSQWLLGGIAFGAGFLVFKTLEFAAKFGEGIGLSTNLFYMFYLCLTFFHYMHVILGMVILLAVWVKTRQGAYGPANCNGLESGAAYWHMVDLVWIVLFPLVYVMR